jgi:hypothetical protein
MAALLNLKQYRLVRGDALSADEKQFVSRLILFLKSGLPYEWPNLPPWPWMIERWNWRWPFRTRSGNLRYEAWTLSGEHDVWPFFHRLDFERAQTRRVYLNGCKLEKGAGRNVSGGNINDVQQINGPDSPVLRKGSRVIRSFWWQHQ